MQSELFPGRHDHPNQELTGTKVPRTLAAIMKNAGLAQQVKSRATAAAWRHKASSSPRVVHHPQLSSKAVVSRPVRLARKVQDGSLPVAHGMQGSLSQRMGHAHQVLPKGAEDQVQVVLQLAAGQPARCSLWQLRQAQASSGKAGCRALAGKQTEGSMA